MIIVSESDQHPSSAPQGAQPTVPSAPPGTPTFVISGGTVNVSGSTTAVQGSFSWMLVSTLINANLHRQKSDAWASGNLLQAMIDNIITFNPGRCRGTTTFIANEMRNDDVYLTLNDGMVSHFNSLCMTHVGVMHPHAYTIDDFLINKSAYWTPQRDCVVYIDSASLCPPSHISYTFNQVYRKTNMSAMAQIVQLG